MEISQKTQDKIVRLYQNDKLSCSQIAGELNISNSAVCYWLIKKKVEKRSISEAITNINITKFNKKPFRLKKKYLKSDYELKIAGVMLYWGEGAKNGGSIKFTNSNPEMIALFLRFLRRICGISEERVKALIHIYPDHNEEKLKRFWSRITKIPAGNFYKSYIHIGRIGTYKNKSKYGTLAINYSDKKLLDILLSWIEEYKDRLME